MIVITQRIVCYAVVTSEVVRSVGAKGPTCPDCGDRLIKHEGCEQCSSCGYAKCSL